MEKKKVHRQTVEFLLPLFSAVFSIFTGLLVTFSPVTAPFFYTGGIYILFGILFVLFTGVSLYPAFNSKKRHRLKPKDSVILQGRLFRLWFSGQNLSWAAGLNLFTLILLFFFGPQFEVMAVGAGALACTFLVLIGLFVSGESRTLGLCWQSAVPRGETNWARFTGAAVLLRQRYENAFREDQKRSEPVLWGITRVLERAGAGGADRPVDLMDSPAATRKSEFSHRVKVLVPIFMFTVLFSFFLRELPGLTPPHLLQFAREKSGVDFKKDRDIDGDAKESGEKKSGKDFKEKGKSSDRDLKARKEEPGKEFDESSKDESKKKLTGKDAAETRDESEKKETPDRGRDKSEDISGEKDDSRDSEKAKTESRDSEHKTEGDSEKTAGGEEGKETAGESPGDREGNETGEGDEKGKSEGKGQQEGKEKGEGKGEEKADGQGDGEGEGEGEGRGKSKEKSKSEKEQGQQGSELSEGEGEGKNGQGPGMGSDTVVPIPPPGAAGMLEIDLPTVDRPGPGDRPGAKKPDEKKDVGEAPVSPVVPGQKMRVKARPGEKAFKPEQYLPNWILALLKERM